MRDGVGHGTCFGRRHAQIRIVGRSERLEIAASSARVVESVDANCRPASCPGNKAIASGACHSRYRRKLYFPAGLEDLSFREGSDSGLSNDFTTTEQPAELAEPGKAYEQAEPGNA
jgi:hypothetical protein